MESLMRDRLGRLRISVSGNDAPRDEDTTTVTREQQWDRDIQDFYYVKGLSRRNVAEYLYERFKDHNYFTYFGNVLFYLIPSKGRDLYAEYPKFLYGVNDKDPHLYSLMNEILRTVSVRRKVNHVLSARSQPEQSDLVGSITASSADNLHVSAYHDNYKVFVYGDAMYEQLNVASRVVAYSAQRAHVIGLEPSGKLSDIFSAVHELMAYFNDYTTRGKDFCTLQLTFKLNFGKANQLDSISLIPNMATDHSCLTVSSMHREHLAKKDFSSLFKDAVFRPPSIFYALLYSTLHSKSKRWIANCRLTPTIAKRILEVLPTHEIEDVKHHVDSFQNAIQLLRKIGFDYNEVISLLQVLVSILIFDLYYILRYKDAGSSSLKTAKVKKQQSSGTHKAETDMLSPKDLLIYAAEVLGIELLRKPAKLLKSQDLLFRIGIMSANNCSKFDHLSSALYFRLKHVMYRKINTSLVLRHNCSIVASIAVHCNSGSFPQSLKVKEQGDIEMAKRAGEEVFLQHFMASMENSSLTNDFTNRNHEAVNRLMGENGLLADVVMESHKRGSEAPQEDSRTHRGLVTVPHSCQDVVYDIQAIITRESTIYSLPKESLRLLKYSENSFVLSLFFVKESLQPTVGPCAASLSYLNFFVDCVDGPGNSYYIVCTSPKSCSSLYRKVKRTDQGDTIRVVMNTEEGQRQEDEKEKGKAESLEKALSTNIPVLDLCISQRDNSKATLDLQSAIRTFIPLAYTVLPLKLHRVIPIADEVTAVKLLFNALNVPDSMWKVCGNTLTLPKTLCIKLVARASDYVNCAIDAIRVIQRWWVRHNTLQFKMALRRMVVRMQSRIRYIIFQNHVSALASARNLSIDFIGLCLTIYHLNVSLLSSSHKTLQLLHSMEKRYHDKEYNLIQYAAATYIQSCWRRTLARRKYAQMRHERFKDFSIMLVQATIRRFLATASIVNRNPVYERAATAIQAAYRGYRARVEYDTLCGLKMALLSIVRKGSKLIGLSEQLKFVKERKKHNTMTMQMKKLIIMQTNLPPGFIKAQNLFRMYFIRKQYLNLRSAIEKVQALVLTKVARLAYLEKVQAAMIIQKWWRSVHKQDVAKLSGNAVYYLNVREQTIVSILRGICNAIGVAIVKFTLYHDIRRIYPRSWAMDPIEILGHLLKIQRLVIDDAKAEFPMVTGIDFAIGSYHSLLLLLFSDGSSSLYSWGAPSVLEAGIARKPRAARSSNEVYEEKEALVSMAKPLVFYKNEVEEYQGAGLRLSPLPRIEIKAIACGNDFSLALSHDGKLFTWGNNRHGQCGQGHRLVYIWHPTMLALYAVTEITCGEKHSVARVSVNDYFAFGRIFDQVLYTPQDIKAYHEPVRHQWIETVVCRGFLTLLYTAELNYVLHVIGTLSAFKDLYNLRGRIKGVCTNGYTIYALVEQQTKGGSGLKVTEQRIYAWGHMRCVSRRFKEDLPNTAALVNNFWEKLENKDIHKPKRSMLKVNCQLSKSTFIPMPTEVVFQKKVVGITCDHQQLIIISQNAVVFGASVFEIVNDNPGDIRDSDEYSFRISAEATSIMLEPALYQFTEMEKASGTIKVVYNRHAASIIYTTQH